MEMRTIKCPLEQFKDQEIPLYMVFDTISVGWNVAERVGKVIKWIIFNENPKAAKVVFNILMANLGEKRMRLFTNMYIKTYDKTNMKVVRYHAVATEEEINDIFYIFNKVNELIPALGEIASYYGHKNKN